MIVVVPVWPPTVITTQKDARAQEIWHQIEENDSTYSKEHSEHIPFPTQN